MKKLLIVIMLALSSCSLAPTQMTVTQTPKPQLPPENSIFAESNCVMPCWYGIVIGKTTKQELLNILKSVPVVYQDSITVTDSDTFFDEWVFFKVGKGSRIFNVEGGVVKLDYLGTGQIEILNDKVSLIMFSGDLDLTIQQVVDIFGEPDYAIPFYAPGRDIQVELLSPVRGIDYSYSTNDLDSKLAPGTEVSEIIMFDTSIYDEMIENKQFSFSPFVEQNDLEKYAWKGYGNLSMYWHEKQ